MASVVNVAKVDRWNLIAPKLTNAAERAARMMTRAMERAEEAGACAEACEDDESIPGDVLGGMYIEETKFNARAMEADRKRGALLSRIERGPEGNIPRAGWKREELQKLHARVRDGKLTPKMIRAETARICAAKDSQHLSELRAASAEARK